MDNGIYMTNNEYGNDSIRNRAKKEMEVDFANRKKEIGFLNGFIPGKGKSPG